MVAGESVGKEEEEGVEVAAESQEGEGDAADKLKDTMFKSATPDVGDKDKASGSDSAARAERGDKKDERRTSPPSDRDRNRDDDKRRDDKRDDRGRDARDDRNRSRSRSRDRGRGDRRSGVRDRSPPGRRGGQDRRRSSSPIRRRSRSPDRRSVCLVANTRWLELAWLKAIVCLCCIYHMQRVY